MFTDKKENLMKLYGGVLTLHNSICEAKDCNIASLYEFSKSNHPDSCIDPSYTSSNKYVIHMIEKIKSEFDNIVTPEDESMNNALQMVIAKYNLTNPNQLANKIKELCNADVNGNTTSRLMTIINSAFPGSVSDESSLFIFINELIKQFITMKNANDANNTLYINIDALTSENATLKAMVASLKAENDKLKTTK